MMNVMTHARHMIGKAYMRLILFSRVLPKTFPLYMFACHPCDFIVSLIDCLTYYNINLLFALH